MLRTTHLFIALLRALEIDTVCDVGSMDGSDALAFRRVLPRARILAFEANPHNARRMADDPRLRAANIEVAPVAVTDFDGEADFFLVKADYASIGNRRGMSSLYRRRDAQLHDATVKACATRLDSWLGRTAAHRRRIALWIDVEGAACEAVGGAEALLGEVVLLHVEAEATPCIAPDQKLYDELERRLRAAGFEAVKLARPAHHEQFNVIFVRTDRSATERRRIVWHRARLESRAALVRGLQAICPGCVRRLIKLLRRQ